MDNRQGRKTGWTIIGCGCVFIIFSKLWIGLLMAALGILLICIAGRCPHCGKILLLVSPNATQCPKCHKPPAGRIGPPVACHGTTVPPQGRKEVITGYGKKKIP